MFHTSEELKKDFNATKAQSQGNVPDARMHVFGEGAIALDGERKRQITIFCVVLFVVCLGLVTLNSYARDVSGRIGSKGDDGTHLYSYGSGATVAAESRNAMSFPVNQPILTQAQQLDSSFGYGGVGIDQSYSMGMGGYSQARSPQAATDNSIMPGVYHGVPVPVQDQVGIRMKRVVDR